LYILFNTLGCTCGDEEWHKNGYDSEDTVPRMENGEVRCHLITHAYICILNPKLRIEELLESLILEIISYTSNRIIHIKRNYLFDQKSTSHKLYVNKIIEILII